MNRKTLSDYSRVNFSASREMVGGLSVTNKIELKPTSMKKMRAVIAAFCAATAPVAAQMAALQIVAAQIAETSKR